jgi:hypothetical protein
MGKALAQASTGDLTAEVGLEAAASLPRAFGDDLLNGAQLSLHAGLERTGDGGGEFHILEASSFAHVAISIEQSVGQCARANIET